MTSPALFVEKYEFFVYKQFTNPRFFVMISVVRK